MTHERRRPAGAFWRLAWLLAASIALAGCHTVGTPLAKSPGGEFPLFLQNKATRGVQVHVAILEDIGRTIVYEDDFELEAGVQAMINPVRLPHGEYALRASTDSLSREVEVNYDDEARFFRFVIMEDVIGFQRHE